MRRPAFAPIARAVCIASMVVSIGLSAAKILLAPVTYDEAYSYLKFARLGYLGILSDYTVTNNHIVHTLLLRAVTQLFGNSLVVMRLPAFAGVIALYAALWRLARRLGPAGYLWTAAVALTPTVLNYGALARGYTLGSALSAWAMVLLAGLIDPREERRHDRMRLTGAGLLLGAAIGCVPVFAIVAAGVFAAYLAVRAVGEGRGRIRAIASRSAIACVSVLFPVLVIYWHIRFDPRRWTFGHPTLPEFVQHFWINAYDLAGMDRAGAVALSALFIIVAAAGLVIAFRRRERVAALVMAGFIATALALGAARVGLEASWPFARNMLFLVPLALFAPLYALTAMPLRRRAPGLAVATALVILNGVAAIARFDPVVHREWRSNAGVPAVLAAVVADRGARAAGETAAGETATGSRGASPSAVRSPAGNTPGPATLGIPWQLDPCVKYDLLRRRDGAIQLDETSPEYQVWLATPEGEASRDPVLFTDSHSGLVLTRRIAGGVATSAGR